MPGSERPTNAVARRFPESPHFSAGEVQVAALHPWVPFAGIWKDHPDLDAVLEHITAARRQLDMAESEA
jgi:hypothetical protein